MPQISELTAVTNLTGAETFPLVQAGTTRKATLEDIANDAPVFTQTGTGAIARTINSKLLDTVSVKDFGAVGDGVVDDTLAVHAAFLFCITNKRALYVPTGDYRVTSGFDNTTVSDLVILGDSVRYIASGGAVTGGSCFILDSTDPASYFYSQSNSNELTVRDMRFSCAQFVQDRKFFKTSASSCKHLFTHIHFTSVERPYVYDTGTYMQLAKYDTVRFTSSGTFHSNVVDGTLIGTLITINNIEVEGTVPENTEKIICNLSGFRQGQSQIFLIEPGLPSLGWTILKLYTWGGSGEDWVRRPLWNFEGLWFETTTNPPTYALDIYGGRVTLNHAQPLSLGTFRLWFAAELEIKNTPFVANGNDKLDDLFLLQDERCHVRFCNCNFINILDAIKNPQYTFDSCSYTPNGDPGADPYIATSFNNEASRILWEFDGGYLDSGKVDAQIFAGSVLSPSSDATYGRKITLSAGGGTTFNTIIQAKIRGGLSKSQQYWVALLIKLPTFATGTIEIPNYVDGANVADARAYPAATFSGQTITHIFPITPGKINPSLVGFAINGILTGVVGDLEIYYAAIGIGKSIPQALNPSYPLNIITRNSSAPAAGSWVRGDYVKQTLPAVGSPKGWYCTVTGTPGTWTSEGNL